MITKLLKRKRRSKKTRAKIRELQSSRLSVHRTPKHMYAQIISPENDTVVSASTLQADIKKSLKNGKTGNIEAAEIRSLRPPEPYKGKGVRYKDEQISLKETKKQA